MFAHSLKESPPCAPKLMLKMSQSVYLLTVLISCVQQWLSKHLSCAVLWNVVQKLSLFAGYYCPMNSSIPYPCPQGTYNPSYYMGQREDCLQCPVDHFNHLMGQAGCFSCGGEASQKKTGQPLCECAGAGRDFQVGALRNQGLVSSLYQGREFWEGYLLPIARFLLDWTHIEGTRSNSVHRKIMS